MVKIYLTIAVLIILSAFFSGSETAFFTLSRVQLKMLGERGGKVGAAIAKLLSNPRRVLNTLLLCNLLVNTILSALLSKIFLDLFGPSGLPIAVFVVTVLLLIFGEITPKVISLGNYMTVSKIAVYPISFCCYICAPFRFALRIVSNGILRLMGLPLEKADRFTRETYLAALMSSKEKGALEMNEADMIHAICAFRTMKAVDVRTPRTEMTAISEEENLFQAVALAERTGVYFLPVFRGSIDRIVGILEISALSNNWRTVKKDAAIKDLIDTSDFIHPPFLSPGTRLLDELIEEMRDKKEMIAIILDEYGGTDGVIQRHEAVDTMLGGIMGLKEREIHFRPNGDIISAASAKLVDLNWECSLNFPTDLDATLAGYIMRVTGKIPEVGYTFESEGLKITILKRSGLKLETVRLRPIDNGGAL